MKAKEIRDLSDAELARTLGEAREAHFNLRFQHASGALERTSELSSRRREIARILTIAHEREQQS
ncbi:50S ribosomal protein L29 [Miltoncostaea oceani]|jgi:large subunit ribosomal protein L29|uniref:50S ribosomal protein L29 n=1 Tax=Miltoncostaea oceani TaxID=2843216 RepID=UPI001C3D436A|nr:50S ribosomal protein L29 [Miltoncostaea oceani]